jgi:hypothetical protein
MTFRDYVQKAGDEAVLVSGYGYLTRKQAFDSALGKAKEIVHALETTGEVSKNQFMLLQAFYEASKGKDVPHIH